MNTQDKNFWNHLDSWQPLMDKEYQLYWDKNWLKNGWCKDCQYCCGPQGADEPFPMALLPQQIGPDNIDNFYMLNAETAYIGAKGCKSDSDNGCRLPEDKKPVACGLFPLVLVNGRLYLYKMCPAVLGTPLNYFFEIGKKASQMLNQYSLKDLQRISITLPQETLLAKYIDLHLPVFEADRNSL